MGCMQNLMLLQTGLKMLKLVLFTACALAAAAAPAPILPAASEVQMSSCLHYMEDLWFDLAEETGKPKNISQSPTSVFCIPDYGEYLNTYIADCIIHNSINVEFAS